jgi:hypothetical protein
MDPLEIAMLIERSTPEVHRTPEGLYVLDATEPPTEVTLRQYEAGMHVLGTKKKVAAQSAAVLARHGIVADDR